MLKRHDINLIERHICSFYPNHGTPFLMPRRFSPACHLWQACLLIHCFIFKLMFEKNLFHVNGAVWWRWRWRWTKRKSEKKLIAIQLYVLLLLAQIILIQGTHQMSWFRASQVGAHTSPFFTPFSDVQLYLVFSLFQFVQESGFTPNDNLLSSSVCNCCLLAFSIYCVCTCVCTWLIPAKLIFRRAAAKKALISYVHFLGIIFAFCSLCTQHANQQNKTKQKKREKELRTAF